MSTNQNPEPGWFSRLLAQLQRIPARPLLALAAVLLAGGSVALVVDWDGDGPAPAQTITLGGPGQAQLRLTPRAQDQLDTVSDQAEEPAADVHADLAGEPAAAQAPAVVGHNAAQRPAGQPAVPSPLPLAAASVPGCRTKLVRNFSSRGGAPVLLGVIHYTASPPTLGWSGVDGNTAWFDTAAASASSNEIMSRDGKCNLVVAEASKAWTQAGFNPWSVSVELVTDGTPATLMTPEGDEALSRLVVGWHRRWGIPLRRGAVSGCKVVRTGIVDHQQLGACGGGHGDIAPYDVDGVIAKARAYLERTATPLTKVEQRIVAGAKSPRGTGHSRKYWCQRNVDRRALLLRLARTTLERWGLKRGARYQLLGGSYRASCNTR